VRPPESESSCVHRHTEETWCEVSVPYSIAESILIIKKNQTLVDMYIVYQGSDISEIFHWVICIIPILDIGCKPFPFHLCHISTPGAEVRPVNDL
jgi:hypothetical protein